MRGSGWGGDVRRRSVSTPRSLPRRGAQSKGRRRRKRPSGRWGIKDDVRLPGLCIYWRSGYGSRSNSGRCDRGMRGNPGRQGFPYICGWRRRAVLSHRRRRVVHWGRGRARRRVHGWRADIRPGRRRGRAHFLGVHRCALSAGLLRDTRPVARGRGTRWSLTCCRRVRTIRLSGGGATLEDRQFAGRIEDERSNSAPERVSPLVQAQSPPLRGPCTLEPRGRSAAARTQEHRPCSTRRA